jgi:hypothetical protein
MAAKKKPTTQLTLDQAYQAAYLWLDFAGDPPIEISEPAHGSVELITERAFVRVRSSDAPVEQSSVLALLRAAGTGKKLVIFSPSGFSPGALSIAETQGIALYTLDTTGRAIPETTHARSFAPEEEPEPPFAPSPAGKDDDLWTDLITKDDPDPTPAAGEHAVPGIDAATTDWADCPSCGVTHYRNAKFCRECGTSLVDGVVAAPVSSSTAPQQATAVPKSSTGSKLRCRTCGGHDIELLP